MKGFLTGSVRLVISGERVERFLTAAAGVGIEFWNATAPEGMTMTLWLRRRDAEKGERLARRMGFDCERGEEKGLSRPWRSLRRRGVLIAALGLCALALVSSRAFIWRVEIADTANLSESEVREALRECGVDVGVFWPALSQDLTRNALLRRLPQLRWATVNIRGGTAEVILRPAREKPAIENEDECADIVARRGGVITEVQALRGAAQVTEGETVLAGDTLIAGEAIGRYESHGATRAIGTVQARTWYEMTAAASVEAVQAQPGDCILKRWALIFGKRRINFYKGCSICPPGCAKMEEETVLAVGDLFSLPLRIVCERVYETKTQSAADETRAERMEQQLLQRLRALLPQEGEVRAYSFTQSAADGWLYVTLHAECSEPVGVTVPMTAEQIAAKTPQTKEEDP